MISNIRTSRKSALFFGVAFVVMIVTFFAFKDLNEKLQVMAASNAGYQKMTDSQSDKIRSLVSEISDMKGSSSSVLWWMIETLLRVFNIVLGT